MGEAGRGHCRGVANGRSAPTRVSFYTRISTDEDHQKCSLDAQKDRLEAYCKAQWGDDWPSTRSTATPRAAPT